MPTCRICGENYTDVRLHRNAEHPTRDVGDIEGPSAIIGEGVIDRIFGRGREERGSIQGRVVDATNNNPIRRASVNAGGSTVATNLNGNFRVDVRAGRSYSVHISADGYDTENVQSNVVQPNQTVDVGTIQLQPLQEAREGNLEGTVSSAAGPIRGATVDVGGHVGNTDDFGHYEIANIPTGRHTAQASAGGFRQTRQPIRINAGANQADFKLEQVGNVIQNPRGAAGRAVGFVTNRSRIIRAVIALIITLVVNFLFYQPIVIVGLNLGDPFTPPWWILTWFVPIAFFFAVYNVLPNRQLEARDWQSGIVGAVAAIFVWVLLNIGPLPVLDSPTIRWGIPIIVFFVITFITRRNIEDAGVVNGLGRTILWLTGIMGGIGLIFYVGNLFTTGAFLNIETYLRPLDVLRVVGVPQETIDGMKQGIRSILSFLNIQAVQPLKPEVKKVGGFEAIQVKFGASVNSFKLPTMFARMDYLLPVTVTNPNKVDIGTKPVKSFTIDEVYIVNGSVDRVMCGTFESEPIVRDGEVVPNPQPTGKTALGDIKPEEEKTLVVQFTGKAIQSGSLVGIGNNINCAQIISSTRGVPSKPLATAKNTEYIGDNIAVMNKINQCTQGLFEDRICLNNVCLDYCRQSLAASNSRYRVSNDLDEKSVRYLPNDYSCDCRYNNYYNIMDNLCFISGDKATVELRAKYDYTVEGKGDLIVVKTEADRKLAPKPQVTSSSGPLTVTTYFIPDVHSLEKPTSKVTLFIDVANGGKGSAEIKTLSIKGMSTDSCVPKPKTFLDSQKSVTFVCDAADLTRDLIIQGSFATIPLIVDMDYTYTEKFSTSASVEKKFIPEAIIVGSDEYSQLHTQFFSLPYYCERGLSVYGLKSSTASTPTITGPGSTTPGTCPTLDSGPCSVSNLQSTCFGTIASTDGFQASQICKAESGANPNSVSGVDKCRDGTSFSFGLFQVNVIAHASKIGGDCLNLFSKEGSDSLGTCLEYSSTRPDICVKWNCWVNDMEQYDRCVQKIKDPNTNIQVACQIYQGRNNWCPWRINANICGLGPC